MGNEDIFKTKEINGEETQEKLIILEAGNEEAPFIIMNAQQLLNIQNIGDELLLNKDKTVSGKQNVGILAGYVTVILSENTIINSTVNGITNVGVLTGCSTGTLTGNVTNETTVNGTNYVGGLVGYSTNTVKNNIRYE